MRSGRCRRQPKATLRLYKPRQMAVCLYSLGPSDAGRIFRNAHVRISRACRPLRQGEHHHCTGGLSPVRPQAFPAALRTGCRVCCQARQTTASQAATFSQDVTKSIAAPSYYGEGYLPRAFFAEGKERKKGRTAMKKRGPFAVFLFHLSAAFLPCDQTVCLHHTGVRGVGAKQRAKKKPVFGKKKFHGIRRFHGTLVRSTGLEPVPLSDTPLKRARMPIPPRSRVAVLQR